MAKLQDAVAHDPHVQLVTFTVDPQTDTPAVLAKYADQFGADPNRWWFLTGPEKPLYDLIQNGFLQAVQDNSGQPPQEGQYKVTHSTYLALVDADGDVRGFYDGVGAEGRADLLRDIQKTREGRPIVTTTDLPVNETRTPLSVVAAIIAISAVASLFLCWLVYYHAPADVTGTLRFPARDSTPC